MKDLQLIKIAKKKKVLKQQIAELTAQADELDRAITAEMEARGTKAIEAGGIRVTYVVRSTEHYDLAWLKQQRPKAAKAVIRLKEEIDKSALESMLAQGVMSIEDLSSFVTVTYSKPWANVSEAK